MDVGKGASRTKRKACQTVNDTNESTPSAQSQEKRLRLDDSGSSLVSVLPAEIWFQIFSLLPSRRLLETVGCVNHEWRLLVLSRITTYHLNVNQPKKSVKREEGEDDEEVEFKQPSSEPDATTLQMIMNLMTQCARLRTLEITFSHRIPEELDAPNAPFSIKDYDSEPSEDEFMSDDLDEWALERQTGIKNSWFCYCLRAHKSKKENCSQYYKRKSGVTICDEAMIDDEYVYRKSRKRKLELAMAKILKNVPEGEERRMVPRIQLRIDEMNIRDDRVQEAIESLGNDNREEQIVDNQESNGEETRVPIPKLLLDPKIFPKHIKCLILTKSAIEDSHLRLLPRGLLSLDLSHSPLITNRGLADLPPSLTFLKMDNCFFLSDLSSLPRSLTELSIQSWDLRSDSMLSDLPSGLTSLDLTGCHGITGDNFLHLPMSIRSLSLNRCRNITSLEGLSNQTNLESLNCGNLNYLHLRGIPASVIRLDVSLSCLSEESLDLLPSSLQELTMAHLLMNEAIPDTRLGLKFPASLKRLKMHGPILTEEFLECLPKGLESLHLNARTSLLESGKLNLRRFESLHTLAMCCPGLNSVLFPSTITDLTLRRSTRINGGSLADLPTSLTRLTLTETFEARTTPFKKLHPFATYLDLSDSFVLDGNLRDMVSTIKRVNLTGTSITAKGLRYLPSGLEELILCDCPKLGDDIITFLPRDISTLYIFNCPKITVNVELERPDVCQFKFCAPPNADFWRRLED